MNNLNNLDIVSDDFSRVDKNNFENQVASVSAYFRDIKKELLHAISKADAVFGCAAWLTDDDVINALNSVPNISIVVSHSTYNAKSKMLKSHKNWIKLRDIATKFNHFHTIIGDYAECIKLGQSDDAIAPLLVLDPKNFGTSTEDKTADSMLHNKFLIFAKVFFDKDQVQSGAAYYYSAGSRSGQFSPDQFLQMTAKPTIVPFAVWTGSFNFSANANSHLENAVLIHNERIAEAYFNEFSQIYSLSQIQV